MKNPFKSIEKIFTKSIPKTANSIFSKNNVNEFRNKVSDTLKEQGKILQTVGKISGGVAAPIALASMAFPALMPVAAGLGGLALLAGGTGLIESSSGNLMKPSLYAGKNKLQTTSNVVNQIEKAAKGTANITKFA